jgi:hypothetical protein
MAYVILAWVSPIFARSPRAITVLSPCPDGDNTTLTEIRRRVGLKEGDRVEFVVQGDWTIIRPARPEKSLRKICWRAPGIRLRR